MAVKMYYLKLCAVKKIGRSCAESHNKIEYYIEIKKSIYNHPCLLKWLNRAIEKDIYVPKICVKGHDTR